MEHQGPFTFEEMSQLPICSPIPVGQGKFLAGATVPMARPAWNLDERDSIPDASALMELARPWRGSSDPHWQDRREAKYFHPESKSAYCMITSQSWMAMSQLEESEAKPGLDVAVALIPSAKIWLGTERGPTAKNCFWDWPAFWGAYNGFTAQARQGLFHGNHYFWLTMEGRYLAALFRRVMDQNGRNIAFKGLTGTHVHSTLWKVWDPMIAVKLPLQASMALFLKHAKAKTVAAAECWKERSHIQSFHSRWLDPSAPINRSAPLVFTPQPNGKFFQKNGEKLRDRGRILERREFLLEINFFLKWLYNAVLRSKKTRQFLRVRRITINFWSRRRYLPRIGFAHWIWMMCYEHGRTGSWIRQWRKFPEHC